MARDPAGTYSYPPGIEGVPDQTIDSNDYNAFLHDVQSDLNFPRPITSGGTGATSATAAMTNLNGEIAKQLVDNYDMFPFAPGSFYSIGGATAEPVAGHNFIGICYMKDADNIVLEARDESDTTKPGRRYVRERKITSPSPTSAWLPWRQEGLAIVDNGGGDISVGISGSAADMVFGLRGTAPTSFFAVNTKADGTGTNALRVDKDGTVSFGGTVSIPTTPTDPNAPASKSYVDTGDAAANANANNRVLKSGDTITGNLGVTGYIYGAQHGAGAAGTEIPNAAWVRGYAQPYDPQLFAGIPTFSPGNGYVTVGTDSQKCIWMTGGVTINSGAHPVNACITFIAWGGNLVIANNANMYSNINQTFSSGSRTLLQGGIATAIQFAGGYWIIAGNGLQ